LSTGGVVVIVLERKITVPFIKELFVRLSPELAQVITFGVPLATIAELIGLGAKVSGKLVVLA
jgi:hypothetical protein